MPVLAQGSPFLEEEVMLLVPHRRASFPPSGPGPAQLAGPSSPWPAVSYTLLADLRAHHLVRFYPPDLTCRCLATHPEHTGLRDPSPPSVTLVCAFLFGTNPILPYVVNILGSLNCT